MKFQLINEWQKAYKFFSVQCMTIAGAILATWTLLPDDLKAGLPPSLVPVISMSVLTLGVIGRLVDQQPKAPE